MNNREKGSRYEDIATAYLQDKGLVILEKNFRCRLGEIDIIARDGRYLCFEEIKYRASGKNGYPFEAVGKAKQRKIMQVAANYLKFKGIGFDTPCRFDVVSILGEEITWYKNAFGSF